MELGELLYNKSEYIETVRAGLHFSPPFSSLCPFGAGAPSCVYPTPAGPCGKYGSVWPGLAVYSLDSQFTLSHFNPDFLVEIKCFSESRTSLVHPNINYSSQLRAFKNYLKNQTCHHLLLCAKD